MQQFLVISQLSSDDIHLTILCISWFMTLNLCTIYQNYKQKEPHMYGPYNVV